MKHLLAVSIILGSLVAFSNSSFAAPATDDKRQALFYLLGDINQQHIKILEEIDIPQSGLTAFVVRLKGDVESVFYITQDMFGFWGALSIPSSSGPRNITDEITKDRKLPQVSVKLYKRTESPSADKIASQSFPNSANELSLYEQTVKNADTHSVQHVPDTNDFPTNVVYVFSDPACPYCQRFHSMIDDHKDWGAKFVMLPVSASEGDKGEIVAALMLDGKVPITDMGKPEKMFSVNAVPTSESILKVRQNRQILSALANGYFTTPTLIYKNSITGEIHSHAGSPDRSSLKRLLKGEKQ